MTDEESRELPIGEAKKLGELAREKWHEHLLLFSEVKNRVLWVNPNVDIPVKLEKGESSPLGLFVEATFRESPEELPEGKHALEVWRMHRRSALLGRVIFADDKGRCYRDIDLKGIGHVFSAGIRSAIVLEPSKPSSGVGLLDRDSAFYDRQVSEEFLLAGIRTHRVLATIELKELIVNQRKLSLREAIEEGIIDDNFHPVVELRAFGTKTRIIDIGPTSTKEERELLFKDAKKLVSQELGYKKPMVPEEYLNWFAKTLGVNVGLMHKNGWFHGNPTVYNITLDCRVVDLDSVTQLTNESEQGSDLEVARHSLDWLLGSLDLDSIGNRKSSERQFQEGYDFVFPPEERKRYFNRVSKKK